MGWLLKPKKVRPCITLCFTLLGVNKSSNREEMSNNQEHEALLNHSHNSRKGGLRTMPFIIVNESFERLASTGLAPNMIIYLTTFYHIEVAPASILLGIWSALSNGLAIVGAFVSDSYLGRFKVVAIGSISSLIGIGLLWLTTIIPQLRPSPCNDQQHGCSKGTTAVQYAILLCSFGLISIGAGFVRPCSIALGADQLDNKNNPNNQRVIDSYFNWFYCTIGASSFLAISVIVYIQDHFGWKVGFGVPAMLMILSVSIFLMGSPLYIKVKASGSNLFAGLFQVAVAAFRKRHINVHQLNYNDDRDYYKSPESELFVPSSDFRCLNRACIIEDPHRELKPADGTASNPWSLCSVEQVESCKSFVSVLPMWSTGFMILVSLNSPFSIFQMKSVNRHMLPWFEIPAGSFGMFTIIALTIWSALYDRVVVPLLTRYTRHETWLSPVFRMGVGLVISCITMGLSAITESIRRNKAIEEGFQNDPNAVVSMSAMWFVPQYALIGLAEALNVVAQIEFFYTLFPKSMSSFALALYTVGISMGSLLSSVLVWVVDGVTSAGGNTSWLSSNINRGHLDYYYWLLTFLSVINFLYFLLVCRFYHGHVSHRGGK